MSTLHANTTVAPLRFSPPYEHPAPDEAKTLADINEQMRRIQEKTLADGGKALRSVHAKSHGLLVGELRIPAGLAPELAQGLFARPGTLPVVIRLSTTPGDILPDDVSTPRPLVFVFHGHGGCDPDDGIAARGMADLAIPELGAGIRSGNVDRHQHFSRPE